MSTRKRGGGASGGITRTTATLRRLLVASSCALFLFAGPRAAFSSPPANDNFADAGVISTLPFTDSGDLNGTTTEAGESTPCIFQPQTVWYTFTPSSTTVITADLNGSSGGMVLTAYQSNGGGIGGLGYMSCIFGGSLTFTANAGTTYYFQIGSYYYGSVRAQFNVREIPPPPNDDFANATPIGAVPFANSVDITATTTEPSEPATPAGFQIAGSAWYVFTATETKSLTASASGCCTTTTLAAYTGDSLTGLTEVKSTIAGMLTFSAIAGTTYHIQLGRLGGFGGTITMSFRLESSPPPVANFGVSPFDPSVFDNVQIYSNAYDPVGIGIRTATWSFGDGSTDAGFTVFHRYPADADYTVELTVTTFDGRTGSSSQVVHVKTHDVGITRFVAPSSASAGQTRAISVDLRNTRYTEMVQVQLLKSVPGSYGFQLVGTLTHEVPASRNRTIPFDFNYTFTSDDAAIGKVTFEAIATIVNNTRDALSADNTAISLPTRVR
jgi:PKD domain-containing protein